ncbi:carbon dioxide concentrating mechanism protein [Microcoleus sp.]|uniref:carbon dioxide concentrating mechanism protein n=1 Tax=Microcoleus sp. TaxID=44472 RepID=UPI0035938B8C
MYLSPLQLSSNSQILMSGDVVVNESAAIAPGVILQADPGSRISIAAGACIGMGTILHAREGDLDIGAGAILGAGVLVVGAGTIGENACIGAATTLINPSIDKLQILPAGSLIGDTSRQVPAEVTAEAAPEPETPEASTPPVEPPVDRPIEPEPAQTQPQTPPETAPEQPSDAASEQPQPANTPTILYGQAHINQLLGTLFPHRQAFNRSQENGQTLSGGSG